MANNKCSGDCMKCAPFQRQYCASQMAYNAMGVMSSMSSQIDAIQSQIKALCAKIEEMNDGAVFNPLAKQPIQDDDEE